MLYSLKLQEPLSVQMTDLLLIRRTQGRAIQECPSLLIRTIGVIDRKNDAIGPHDLQGEQKRWISEEAAGRNIEVLQKVLRHCVLQMLCHRRKHVIDASEHKRNHLPHMTDDDLQGRQAIEHASQNQSQRMNAHLGMPTPTGSRQREVHCRIET